MPNYLKIWQTENFSLDNKSVHVIKYQCLFETTEELAAHGTKENEQIFILAAVDPLAVPLLLASAKQSAEQPSLQTSILQEQESDLGLC